MLFRSRNRLATLKCLEVHQERQHGAFVVEDKENYETDSSSNSGCKSSPEIEHTIPKDCSKPCQIPSNAKEEILIIMSENKDLVHHGAPGKLVKAGSLSKLMTASDELKKLFRIWWDFIWLKRYQMITTVKIPLGNETYIYQHQHGTEIAATNNSGSKCFRSQPACARLIWLDIVQKKLK